MRKTTWEQQQWQHVMSVYKDACDSFLFLRYAKLLPILGPLHMLLPLPRGLSHQICVIGFFLSFRSQSKYLLFKEVFSDHPIKIDQTLKLLSHYFILLFTWHIIIWHDFYLFVYLVIVCFPWLMCKFHKYKFNVLYTMLGTLMNE